MRSKIFFNWFLSGSAVLDPLVSSALSRADALGYTKPSGLKLTALNNFILNLRTNGIVTLLDELKIYAYNDVSLQNFSTLNLINPLANQSTVIGANMTYGVNGWLGGTTSALNTNFIPSTHGVNFTLNNASQGVYVYNDALNANQVIGSVGSAGVTTRTYMFVRFTATSFNVNISSSGVLSTGANATSLGLHSSNRVSSVTSNYYIDGVLKQSAGTAAGSLSDRAIYVAGFNNNGATVANNTQGVGMNYHGANLTSKMVEFNSAWVTYLASI
jgi:hypothetical protein